MVEELFKPEIFKMKKLGLMLLILMVLPSVSAITQMNIYVDSVGDALFLGESDMSLNLPEGVSLVNGKISGVSSGLTTKIGNLWIFEYSLPGAEMSVILPPGAVIKSLSNGEVYLERERIAVFVGEGARIEYTVEKSSGTNSPIVTGIILLVIALVSVFLLVRYLKKDQSNEEPNKINRAQVVKEILNEREKLIVENLESTGKIKSSLLRKKCDIPKASFSRHLQELEKKGLIKRTGEGKNKFVELSDSE